MKTKPCATSARKKRCVKVDDRRKDWAEDKCYEEKDYFFERKYYVKETKYDDCDKKKDYKKSY